jgi:multiple sugar transport system ATP-binding protein
MASVRLLQVGKKYENGPRVVQALTLEVADGEFMVLVGPSGSGKSTVLRMIAGLEEITEGELLIDGVRSNELAPSERGVAMVFQNYALYPHMTVAENMSFALRVGRHRLSRREIREAVARAAEILQLTNLLDRRPRQLSGGQRQRVAIGRAIVCKPKVFLFDEPLSNLDAALRVQMRIELAKLHAELGTTMVYVTHDQVEAMTLGDRIAVVNGGRIEQVGPPLALYDRPANQFVAGFLGSPKMNFLRCRVEAQERGVGLRVEGGPLFTLPPGGAGLDGAAEVLLGVRPEHMEVVAGEPAIAASVDLVEHLGDTEIIHATLPAGDQKVALKRATGGAPLRPGQTVLLRPRMECCRLFGVEGASLQPS